MRRVMLGDLGSPSVLHEIELVLMEEECQPSHYNDPRKYVRVCHSVFMVE